MKMRIERTKYVHDPTHDRMIVRLTATPLKDDGSEYPGLKEDPILAEVEVGVDHWEGKTAQNITATVLAQCRDKLKRRLAEQLVLRELEQPENIQPDQPFVVVE